MGQDWGRERPGRRAAVCSHSTGTSARSGVPPWPSRYTPAPRPPPWPHALLVDNTGQPPGTTVTERGWCRGNTSLDRRSRVGGDLAQLCLFYWGRGRQPGQRARADSGAARSQRWAGACPEVPALGGPAESCRAGGGGSKVLLGLLMSPSPVSVRSAMCSPSTVWMSPASTSCA